tara:strand:- start:729 stop:1265 length:537 start_codon:yes stop_codon:yes gene_type:complete
MIEGHTFVDAYFVNQEYNIVESLWYSIDEDVTRSYTVVAEENDNEWKRFLKTPIDEFGRCVTVDDLMERTYIRNQELETGRNKLVLDIVRAEREQSLFIKEVEEDVTKDTIASLLRAVFTIDRRPDSTEEENKERLFLFKLAVFEWEELKGTDKEFKKNIRKAKNATEVLYHICNELK